MVKTTQSKKLTRKQLATRISIVTVILIVDITFTGYLKFGVNTIRCLGIPVAIRPPAFGVGSSSYWMPGKYSPGGSTTDYVCSEQQAIEKGIDRNPLQGPENQKEYDEWLRQYRK